MKQLFRLEKPGHALAMDWDDLHLYLHVARCRSMSQAAERIGASVPTIARRIDRLEQATGLKLIKRTPRGLLLTDQGRHLAEGSDGLAREFATLERLVLRLKAGSPVARVRVSATEPVIAEILAPRLSVLLARAAPPHVELRVENSIAPIALTEIDIAVRLVRPEVDSLMARKIATLEFGLFGSPDHLKALAKSGESVIKNAAVLSYDDLYGPIPELQWLEAAGLADRIVARMSSTRGLIAAAVSGAGIAILPVILARPAGLRVAPMQIAIGLPTREVWLVWHRTMTGHGPTRQVMDWITEAFKEALLR